MLQKEIENSIEIAKVWRVPITNPIDLPTHVHAAVAPVFLTRQSHSDQAAVAT